MTSLQQWTYTEQNTACLTLLIISSLISNTLLRAVCLMSVPLTEDKWQGTLGHKTEYEEVDLIRHGLKIIWNISVACLVIWYMKKRRMPWKWRSNLCLSLVNKTVWRTSDVCWLCVYSVHCAKGKNFQKGFKFLLFYIIIIVLEQQAAYCVIKLIKLKYKYCVSFKRTLFKLQGVVSWWTVRNYFVPQIIWHFRRGFT